jgi:lipoprotein-anchoring transpeptidase ErfK/SrfK
LTGDDETFPTNPGNYIVERKDEDYYSHKYKTPMRYSLFFDLQERKAIHEGKVPHNDKDEKELRTRGCIHVEQPYIKELYDWAEEGNTIVVIQGWRTKK